jgi:hypothetical protein
MTNIQKWQAATAELLRDAGRSDRQIAEALGFSASFVGKVRKALEADGKLQPGKRVGQDGRRRRLPRNLKAMRERLLALLLKDQKKRRKDIDDLAAGVQRLTAKQLEEYLAALEGEKSFASGQPEGSPPPDQSVVPTSNEELIKWGLVSSLESQGMTEEEAKLWAEALLAWTTLPPEKLSDADYQEIVGDLRTIIQTDPTTLIEEGRAYLARRASKQNAPSS